jgi:hypothetical protein
MCVVPARSDVPTCRARVGCWPILLATGSPLHSSVTWRTSPPSSSSPWTQDAAGSSEAVLLGEQPARIRYVDHERLGLSHDDSSRNSEHLNQVAPRIRRTLPIDQWVVGFPDATPRLSLEEVAPGRSLVSRVAPGVGHLPPDLDRSARPDLEAARASVVERSNTRCSESVGSAGRFSPGGGSVEQRTGEADV